MLAASGTTINNLSTAANIKCVDLYKFVLPNGTTLYWSGGDRPFTVASSTYTLGPLLTRSKTTRKVGLDVDTVTVTVSDDGTTLLNGRPLLQAILNGEFTGALVIVYRMFLTDFNDVTPGTVTWFFGYVSNFSGSQGKFDLSVKSMLGYLDVPMPKSLYMPTCNNTFGDNACGKSKTALTETGTVSGGSDNRNIYISGPAHIGTADYFELGVVTFTSGVNSGISRTIRQHSAGVVTLSPALLAAPAAGDGVKLYPSCHKTDSDCDVKYANLSRNRAYPFVPAPATLYSSSNTPGAQPSSGTGRQVVGTRGGAYATQGSYVQ